MTAKGSLGIFIGWPIATPLRLRENVEGGPPPPPDPDWVADFQSAQGRAPNQQDWQDHLLSLRYPGTGPNGEWLDRDWQVYYRLVDLLGGDLLSQIGKPGGHGAAFYSGVGVLLALWKLEPGPDGTRIAYVRNFPAGGIPPNTTGWTWGNTILILESERNNRPLLMHEYTHVLQYRHKGIRYVPNYLKGGLYNWDNNPYEMQGVEVQQIYEWNPWLPPIWEIVWAGGRSG
ncbi:MAG: hypothetical protein H5T65_00310 [Chloroflexi bacterium]|nr:hypothetical protein [Chloroflexota bacterium]